MVMKTSFFAGLFFIALIFYLALVLFGFLPLILVLVFLLSASGIGLFLLPKRLSTDSILLKLVLACVVGLQILSLVFLLWRLVIKANEVCFFFALLFIGLFLLFFYFLRSDIKKIYGSKTFSRLALGGLILCFFCLLFVSRLMFQDGQWFYFQDSHHPIYELSIERAVETSMPPKDLSFLGKPLQFHFGSAILASLFVGDLKIDPLIVFYRVFPFLAVIFFFALSFYLAKLSGLKKNWILCLPLAVLFFYPFLLPLPAKFSLFPKIFSTLISSPSFTMGFLASLALLILIAENLKTKRSFPLLIPILGAILFITKASFFAPLGLALGIFYLQKFILEKKWQTFILPAITFGLALPFYWFLKGAHSHNLWILAPDALIFKRLPNFLGLNESALSLPLLLLASPFIFYGFLSLVYFYGFIRFYKNRKVVSWENFLIILAIVSCSFPFFISEASEGNARQFILLGCVALFLLGFKWLRESVYKKFASKKASIVLLCLLLAGMASGQFVLKTYKQIQKPKNPSYTQNLADSLVFLNKNTKLAAIVLFGKHYESPNWKDRQFVGQWDYLSFFRTALSGRQTIVEDFKYRGIGMQKDYNARSIENFRFFYNIIEKNLETAKGWEVPFGYQAPADHREQQANLSFVKPLWLSGEENWFSVRKSFPQFLEQNWGDVLQEDKQFLTTYINFYKVDYIVFERNEKPRPDIIEFLGLKLFFEKQDVSIYQTRHY